MFQTKNLYQNDPQWKSSPLGNSTESIGGWGCLLTSITMMLNGVGYDETPLTVNEKMKAAGGFQGAFFVPSVVPYVFPNVTYRGVEPCETRPAPIGSIDAALAAGKPVIVQVDWNKDAGIQTHFVLLKERRGDDYVIYDPYKYGGDSPDKEVLLTTRYKYQGQTIESEISGVLWFDAAGQPPAPPEETKVPVPADKFIVYVIEDDLAFRSQPSTSGYLWKRLMAGTELVSLESKSAAQAKLGVTGQWLQVQDPEGKQGYVAAWYVSTDKNAQPAAPVTVTTTTTTTATAAPAAPAAPLPPGALALLPTDELAFRSQPVISPQTLIRRIPVTEQLIALEPSDQVIAKVGVTGQWLKVRDAAGKDGYVAAWYVKYASGAPATPTAAAPPPPAPGGKYAVRTTAEAVAFRKQPVVNDANLIRRLPINTVMLLVDSAEATKVGKNDQWIKVKDPAATEGYVAAWFVTFETGSGG